MINDAISIVLFRAVGNVDDIFGFVEVLTILGSFFYICIASVVIGVGVGFLCSIIIKRTPSI